MTSKEPDKSSQDQTVRNAKVRRNDDEKIPVLEWIVAMVGVVITVIILGFLLWDATAGDRSPPDIAVQVDSISTSSSASGFLVVFHAENKGGTTAANVGIAAELIDGESSVESRSAEIDYLPAHSTRPGGFFFSRDPRSYKLTLRSSGYQKP